MSLSDDILTRLHAQPSGFVFTAKDFLDLGTRAAVDQALTRMSAADTVRRIDRGVYDLPRVHPKFGALWPSADSVAAAIARQTDSHLKPSGPFAANALGLTTQVPAQVVYLTDGPSRTVHVGNLVVTLRHADRVAMLLPDSIAGLAIVALRYLGRDGVTPDQLRQLAARLGAADKAGLLTVQKQLPAWLAAATGQLASA